MKAIIAFSLAASAVALAAGVAAGDFRVRLLTPENQSIGEQAVSEDQLQQPVVFDVNPSTKYQVAVQRMDSAGGAIGEESRIPFTTPDAIAAPDPQPTSVMLVAGISVGFSA